MRFKKTAVALSVAIILGVTAGCGNNSSTSEDLTLSGSVFKGPINNATIRFTDAQGKVLASGGSRDGIFQMEMPPVENGAVFIESIGGSYTDEATGEQVEPAESGLMTVFSATELKQIAKGKQHIAMTPETTLLAQLVKKRLAEGQQVDEAIKEVSALIKEQLLNGTNPVSVTSSEEILRIGNLASTLPANQDEALARNRAVSFSFEVRRMNLAPRQVFELIEKRSQDLEDGTLDGRRNGVALQLQDKNGATIELEQTDQRGGYSQARAELLNHTLGRFMSGNISDAERAELEQMGMDLERFDRMRQQNQDAEAETAAHLAATNLPAFKHLPVLTDEDGNPDDNQATYTLTVESNVQVPIDTPDGSWTTPMLRYNGSALPPVIRAKRGDKMTLPVTNNLDEMTTVHWHGFKVPGDQDGGPDFPIDSGGSRTYSFTISQPAASLWFHPHPHKRTGEQVYRGLAGVFLVDDAISRQLETAKQLPGGQYDIPLLIQDRRFGTENNGIRELAYKTHSADMDGNLGDIILVNGVQLPKLDVESRKYRFRVYNTSNARNMDIALSDGSTFYVVGTDGGLLPEPIETDHILLGAAERTEIVVDFGKYRIGDKVMLISRAFNGSLMMGMHGVGDMGGMMGSSMNSGGMNSGGMNSGGMNSGGMNSGGMGSGGMGSGGMGSGGMGSGGMGSGGMGSGGMGGMSDMMANGQRFDIMRFDIATAATDDITLYTRLPEEAEIHTRLKEADATEKREFVMSMGMDATGGGMAFLINGKSFDMTRIDEQVSAGATEVWTIRNTSPMAHPFHAHAIQWQVLDRNGTPASGVDLGWKDTVLLQPGDTVRIIGSFDPLINTGKYMYHCHILEHEDAGMMGTFEVK